MRDIEKYDPSKSKEDLQVSSKPAMTFGKSRMNSSPQFSEKENLEPNQTSDLDSSYKGSSKISTQKETTGGRNTKGLIHEIENLDEEILVASQSHL